MSSKKPERIYRAHLEVDGKQIIVFPRTKKSSLFSTIAEAEARLTRIRLDRDARGIVTNVRTNETYTIAL